MIRTHCARYFLALLLTCLCTALPATSRASNYYAFGELGQTRNMADGYVGGFFGTHADSSPDRFGFGLGLRFGNGFGVELAQNHLAAVKAPIWFYDTPTFPLEPTTVEIAEPHSTALFATYRYVLADTRTYFGARAGLHRWTAQAAFDHPGVPEVFDPSASGTDTAYGVEAGYQLASAWALGLQWTQFKVNDSRDARLAARVEFRF
jgi:hypothetical protein